MFRNLTRYSQRLAGLLLLLGVTTGLALAQGIPDRDLRLRVTIPGVPGQGIGGAIDAFGSTQTLMNVPSSGGAGVGKAQLSSLVVTKAVDVATPKLFVIAATGQHLSTVQIDWVTKNPVTGVDETFLTVLLQEVLISMVKSGLSNQHDPNLKQLDSIEEVGFTFGTIQWSYILNGTTIRGGFNTRTGQSF